MINIYIFCELLIRVPSKLKGLNQKSPALGMQGFGLKTFTMKSRLYYNGYF
jgi:hypothetical protein